MEMKQFKKAQKSIDYQVECEDCGNEFSTKKNKRDLGGISCFPKCHECNGTVHLIFTESFK
jgi:NAD-dependent SIR2 family protein deacetylase